MSTEQIIILILFAICSFAFGYDRGIRKGMDMAIPITICQTLNELLQGFTKLGMKDVFLEIVNKHFDISTKIEQKDGKFRITNTESKDKSC